MGYHKRKIERGEYGTFSKIQEEIDELMDAREQRNTVMELVELCDLIGAIEGYTKKKYNITLNELIVMTKATQSAFEEGDRK